MLNFLLPKNILYADQATIYHKFGIVLPQLGSLGMGFSSSLSLKAYVQL